MIKMEIILPIYIKLKKSKKEIFVGLNWYRNVNFYTSNDVKKQYHEIVYEQLRGVKQPFEKQIRVKYRLFYKRKDCDLMNVVSVLDKFLLDALVKAGMIKDDNVNKYVECHAEIAGKDSKNPRLVCIISEVEQ